MAFICSSRIRQIHTEHILHSRLRTRTGNKIVHDTEELIFPGKIGDSINELNIIIAQIDVYSYKV